MATLHTTVEFTRKILIGSAVLIGSIFIIIGLFRLSIFLKEVIAPTPPPAPKAAFGKLPRVIFPPSVTQERLTYSIDTVSGFLPVFVDKFFVYEITHDEEPNLFDLDKAKGRVASIDFKPPEKKISETVYEWNDPFMSKRIVHDTLSLNFIFTTDYLNHEPLLRSTKPIDEEMAVKESNEFLKTLGLYPSDIGRTNAQLLTILGDELIPAPSIATATIVRVDYFQKDIEKFKIFYPKPTQSTINVLVSNYASQPVIEANYTHQNISTSKSDYAIKSAQEAYEELQNGKAYIASHFSEDTNIQIREVFLAYYLGEQKQNYLMPIVVFTDKEGFYAYVSAVKDEWLE